MIYKDFETSLTAVKHPINKLPRLGQTTAKRAEDLIRDRLLSFSVKNGVVSRLGRDTANKSITINEKAKALQSQRKLERAESL